MLLLWFYIFIRLMCLDWSIHVCWSHYVKIEEGRATVWGWKRVVWGGQNTLAGNSVYEADELWSPLGGGPVAVCNIKQNRISVLAPEKVKSLLTYASTPATQRTEKSKSYCSARKRERKKMVDIGGGRKPGMPYRHLLTSNNHGWARIEVESTVGVVTVWTREMRKKIGHRSQQTGSFSKPLKLGINVRLIIYIYIYKENEKVWSITINLSFGPTRTILKKERKREIEAHRLA